ncbi:Globin domain containing protein [Pseudohyphozyma bogoriensis]|nr:Globin domain containing protein [Pseudohyphozyma bogoriensis]
MSTSPNSSGFFQKLGFGKRRGSKSSNPASPQPQSYPVFPSHGTARQPAPSIHPPGEDSRTIGEGHVDREMLTDSLEYRITFARSFIGFQKEDGEALNAVASLIEPIITKVVDDVYVHLFNFDYTKQPFMGRNIGFSGSLPESLEQLKLSHPQILFRKSFLTKYVRRVFDADYEVMETWEYMDKVGSMHTGRKGMATLKHLRRKQPIHVDLMACTLLLGWVEDVVLTALMKVSDTELSAEEKLVTIRAFNRLMWIQNDLFQRHYIRDDEEAAFNLAAQTFADEP